MFYEIFHYQHVHVRFLGIFYLILKSFRLEKLTNHNAINMAFEDLLKRLIFLFCLASAAAAAPTAAESTAAAEPTAGAAAFRRNLGFF